MGLWQLAPQVLEDINITPNQVPDENVLIHSILLFIPFIFKEGYSAQITSAGRRMGDMLRKTVRNNKIVQRFFQLSPLLSYVPSP